MRGAGACRGDAGLAAVRRLDVKDAHGPAQQHVGPPEDAHHGELARPHARRLPRSIQTQKEMAAGEGTILDDSHGFVSIGTMLAQVLGGG